MIWESFKKVMNLELILNIECVTSMGINTQTICVSSSIVLKKITTRVFLMKASDSNLKIFKGGQLLWDLSLCSIFFIDTLLPFPFQSSNCWFSVSAQRIAVGHTKIEYLATVLLYFLGCTKNIKLTWLSCIGWIEGERLDPEQQTQWLL